MTTTLANSQQYKIVKADITADRFGDNTLDIKTLISELNLYENIEKPYITGTLLLVDDKGALDNLNFKGTERLEIEISSVSNILEPVIIKSFVMTKIEKNVRTNDRTEVSLITLIEEHYYFNRLVKVSKSFTSYIEAIITEILVGNLNKNVDQSYLTSSAQGVRKINVPYLHPLEAVEWLRDRATTDLGGPFFTYSSVFDDNIRLASLDGLLTQPVFNDRLPYIYSSSLAGKAEDLPEDKRSFLIEDYKLNSAEDSLNMVMKGALGSLYTNTDVGTGLTTRNRFSVRDILFEMKSKELIPDTSVQTVFDDSQFFINQFVDEYDSKVYHQITSSGTYGSFQGYHDVTSSTEHVLKIKNVSIRNMLYRNMMNVIVPGVGLMYSKISVGDKMKCSFLSPVSSTTSENTDDLTDKNKSGEYLIYATRHMFKDRKHSVSANITKLTREIQAGL